MPAWEAVDLCEQLLLDMGSHLYASVSGWSYPMNRGEMHGTALLARVINATAGPKDKPWLPDWPWPDESKVAESVTDEERAALKALLNSRSAFGQKRTEA